MEGNILKKKNSGLKEKFFSFFNLGKKDGILIKSNKENIKNYEEEKNENKADISKISHNDIPDANQDPGNVKNEESLIKFNYSIGDNESVGTNLIKNELTTFFDWKKNIGFLMAAILTPCFVIMFMLGLMIFWEKNEEVSVNTISDEIKSMNTVIEISEKNVATILEFQKRAINAKSVLDNHIYWTNFFKLLEDNTSPDIVFSGLAGSLDSEFTLSATAKNNYFVATDQVRLFNEEKNYILEASTNSASKSEDEQGSSVDFEIKLKIKPEIFTSEYARTGK